MYNKNEKIFNKKILEKKEEKKTFFIYIYKKS